MRSKIHRGFHPAAWLLAFSPLTLSAAPSDADGCTEQNGDVDQFSEVFECGKLSGSLRTLYYSTHNAYFAQGYNQDTISYGGSVKYETAPIDGFNVGVSAILLRGIDHPASDHLVDSIGDNQTNLGEAYVNWQRGQFRVTAGDMRVNIPFVSDYDWRITPILFRAVDLHYGSATDFLHVTRIWRYKPWSDDRFLATTAYTEVEDRSNGLWAIGGGRSTQWNGTRISAQLWYEHYDDYVQLGYAEAHFTWQQARFQPDFGLQIIRGTSAGRALAGEVDSTSYGLQASLTLSSALSWTFGYDHIASSADTWKNGALVLPYAHNSASGPYFAQPFFTSVQDLGSGNAYASKINYARGGNLALGLQYSFMDLKPTRSSPSLNQSEYMAFATWNFGGRLKGLSVSEFVGLQTSPVYDYHYFENRLSVQYDF